MTLLVCLRGSDGLVFATDSRGTFGDPRGTTAQNDTQKKLFHVNRHTVVLTAGSGELGANLMREAQPSLDQLPAKSATATMGALRAFAMQKYGEWFPGFGVQPVPGAPIPVRPDLALIVGGYDLDGSGQATTPRIYSLISGLNFAPMLHDYGFALQGVAQYALYLLNRLYENAQPIAKLENLAAYVITETASQDGKVGGPVQVAIVSPNTGVQVRSPAQVQALIGTNQNVGTALKTAFYGGGTP